MKTTSIMIVGVGGQGTLLASRILGTVAEKAGYDVKLSEVHGMSQRGGSVVTFVKYGEKVYSPIVDKGEADIILAFELLEAERALPFLKQGGKIIVNSQKVNPMPVISGKAEYPKDIEKILNKNSSVSQIDALRSALIAGNIKAVNVVLIGVLAKSTDIPYETWIEAVKDNVPQKFLEVNLRAFDEGYKAI